MRFRSSQIRGRGRGKLLGYPTINLKIPKGLELLEGIYAVKVNLQEQEYIGALHYGPVPVFGETQKALEVFLIDTKEEALPKSIITNMEVEIVQYLRGILNFKNKEELAKQIADDVLQTKKILSQDILGPLV